MNICTIVLVGYYHIIIKKLLFKNFSKNIINEVVSTFTVKHKPLMPIAQYYGFVQPVLYPFRAKILMSIFHNTFNFASQLDPLFHIVLFQVVVKSKYGAIIAHFFFCDLML